jgi:hypothetical protein
VRQVFSQILMLVANCKAAVAFISENLTFTGDSGLSSLS